MSKNMNTPANGEPTVYDDGAFHYGATGNSGFPRGENDKIVPLNLNGNRQGQVITKIRDGDTPPASYDESADMPAPDPMGD